MKGRHKAVIQNSRLHYEFEFKRNISVIRGDSATGKTTLINMLRQYENLGNSSGVDISCDVPCRVLEGREWKMILHTISSSLIFIDEENSFIGTEEFASEAKKSDNYFILITRENLYNLPYSVEEIYGLKSSGRYQNTRQVYQQTYRIYPNTRRLPVEPEKLIVEDSNAGFDFFSSVCREAGIECVSSRGKSNLARYLLSPANTSADGRITTCIIADGAAIGPEMNLLYEAAAGNENLSLYLPESFEWLILKSGIIDGNAVQSILSEPEEYIDSSEFFSWERFFTHLLSEGTKDSYLKYDKRKLNPAYLYKKIKSAILGQIKGIRFPT